MIQRLLNRFDEIIRAQLGPLHVPGCALALIDNREVAVVRVYGFTDLDSLAPVTPDTLFSLQSVSKSFAAWAVMKLVDGGKVDLDAPASRYLKRWTLPASETFDLNLVTPRRLLSHHAGITTRGFRGVEPQLRRYTVVEALRAELPEANGEQLA